MRRRINEAVVSGEAWASAAEKVWAYRLEIAAAIVWVGSVSGLGAWFASHWGALALQGWGVYPFVGLGFALGVTVLVAMFLWIVKNWPRRQAQHHTAEPPAVAVPKLEHARIVAPPPAKADDPAVKFTFPSNWTPCFRTGSVGRDEKNGAVIKTEEVHVCVKTNRRLEGARFQIKALQRRTGRWEVAAQIGSDSFSGTVPKDWEQTFVVMRRTFQEVSAFFNLPPETTKHGIQVRVERDVTLFPENPNRITAAIGEEYMFHVEVFPGDGSVERATFMIDLEKRQFIPQSKISHIANIQAVMGH